MNRIGVTGTDTGVGKTVIAMAIVRTIRQSGRKVAVMKPVETGESDDAERLREASGNLHPLHLVRPVALPEPLAPLIAGRRAKMPVDMRILDETFQTLQASSDAIVVEGAGGLLVPLTAHDNFATLFKRWNLDLVIVAANRLGVINHVLLTVEAARAHGLTIHAVVLNTIHPEPPTVAEQTNHGLLQEMLDGIPVYEFPYQAASPI